LYFVCWYFVYVHYSLPSSQKALNHTLIFICLSRVCCDFYLHNNSSNNNNNILYFGILCTFSLPSSQKAANHTFIFMCLSHIWRDFCLHNNSNNNINNNNILYFGILCTYSLPSSQKALNQNAVSVEMHSNVTQQTQRSVYSCSGTVSVCRIVLTKSDHFSMGSFWIRNLNRITSILYRCGMVCCLPSLGFKWHKINDVMT